MLSSFFLIFLVRGMGKLPKHLS